MVAPVAGNWSLQFNNNLSIQLPIAKGVILGLITCNKTDNSINEGRPGPKAVPQEMLQANCNPTPPYYMRYLPSQDIDSLSELCSILNCSYPAGLQVYASYALKEYAGLLEKRYEMENEAVTDHPALGFC